MESSATFSMNFPAGYFIRPAVTKEYACTGNKCLARLDPAGPATLQKAAQATVSNRSGRETLAKAIPNHNITFIESPGSKTAEINTPNSLHPTVVRYYKRFGYDERTIRNIFSQHHLVINSNQPATPRC